MIILSVAVATYVIGLLTAFVLASVDRADLRHRMELSVKYPLTRLAPKEYEAEWRQACRMQLRAPLWPIDIIAWLVSQIITATASQYGPTEEKK